MAMFYAYWKVDREFTTKHLRAQLDDVVRDRYAVLGTHIEMGDRIRTVVFKDAETATILRMFTEGQSYIYEVSASWDVTLRKKWLIPWEAA